MFILFPSRRLSVLDSRDVFGVGFYGPLFLFLFLLSSRSVRLSRSLLLRSRRSGRGLTLRWSDIGLAILGWNVMAGLFHHSEPCSFCCCRGFSLLLSHLLFSVGDEARRRNSDKLWWKVCWFFLTRCLGSFHIISRIVIALFSMKALCCSNKRLFSFIVRCFF